MCIRDRVKGIDPIKAEGGFAADENGQEADLTSAEAEAPQAVPVPQPTAPRYEPSTTTANVLSLLSTTTHLPAHLKADVAGCAAELRAILNAG